MLVAMVIVGMGVAATYRSIGDSAAKTHELQQRQQAWMLMEGLLQVPAERAPSPLPQTGQSGDFQWLIEPLEDEPAPEITVIAPQGLTWATAEGQAVRPVALRYTVHWQQQQRSISVVTWRLVPNVPGS